MNRSSLTLSSIDDAVHKRVKAELKGGGAAAKKPAAKAKAPAKATTAKAAPKAKTPAPKATPKAKAAAPKAAPKAATPAKAAPKPVAAEPPKPAPAVVEPPTPAPEPVAAEPQPSVPEPVAAAPEPIAQESAAAAPEPITAQEPDAAPTPVQEAVRVHSGITVKDLAEKLDRAPAEIVKTLIGLGEMVSVTQSLSDDALLLVAEELGATLEIVDPGIEEAAAVAAEEAVIDAGHLVPRPPVVTVMGHVDHGKTAILDAIRRTNVAGGEAGGITQHIGAYQVHVNERDVTFIDTPGHEAFTAMRARGAQVTDIAVLVVAADDGVMPQTVEAIDHARAAQVPIVVAVNKVDKPEADPTRVRQQLSDHGLMPEEWGGETAFVDVSAKQRTNLDGLLELILLTADIELDLKANPEANASGVVIEAHLDKGRGPVATVLVHRGTLRSSDSLVAGTAWGRVRAMLDDNGQNVDTAVPGQPVLVLGWQSVPQAGDEFRVLDDEKDAKSLAGEREQRRRQTELVTQRPLTLESMLAQTGADEIPELNVLLKADTDGSVEALADQLKKMDQQLVKINIIRKGVGGITENDVTLAQASNALVIGFNVVPNAQARPMAEAEGVDIRTYRVIYQAVQDIESAAKGLLAPVYKEIALGQAEVRAAFRVPKLGVVAGCMVLDGVIRRNATSRLVRDGTVIYETTIGSLRRFKDDVREVQAGYECGIGLDGYQDIKEGDVIQAFELQEVER